MKNIMLLLSLIVSFSACTLNNALVNASEDFEIPKTSIKILDQESIVLPPKNSFPFSEISDLSYDEKQHKLYMIGDKGYFYTFNAIFKDRITKLQHLDSFKITEKKQQKSYDSEGLAIDDKGQLYISFEKTPRIAKISKKGKIQSNQKLTKKLSNRKNYRSTNKIFEALTWHPKYGLLTAAEYPLKKKDTSKQTIYNLTGKVWHFNAEKHLNSAITAIETMDDGNLLILERAYAGISKPFVITLKKLYLNKCDKKRQCQSKTLASYDSFDGWAVNNYEGLTRVGKNRYLMVSDNNKKSYLSTVFVYFEVMK